MTDTVTLTLTDFLLARIAEDEMGISCDDCGAPYGMHEDECGGYLTVRATAECEAKRRIVEAFESSNSYDPDDGWRGLNLAVRSLATVYADHPDYREEWRP